ncbi:MULTISPECIES: UDP-N-acetylmuramoyl-L-alanyl-D-glutamate--2,6-diaminopimelate ligase [unclassified Breznakia]|uniref:UDP-N-acetylmuramoyl-L-alanyl-D-glutamate--2, 6-diaminopimelate ligase n=1 Tax=unclassified Breznakia TaxID=2623764 RepID=UPI002473AC4E|nr:MULTISPECIES: UDP-N-acetylmuramoyl-L-alanyl-D-glutamate--2,6-diaminopimelate ligase [unclassified Breznakia]MDH6367695.1 UDP-N-acetylmuramoyl-L-alanyl-D-glutamate--2,6-diaminopimelate ligase [Breznakia sp. PH1-1]MDH6404783.1 UDP-N-acetylmuramoyl-L-alanyl-D-glutamate--2,6-diaminopimelate ligase [Breznakia sp. PF1-11]MDH6412510.1 UDP-N-acetylmuramoyl-L-alanyl-D-glutamate--2,6-diaminopimelate ligase [Breznakia sp. PFB1-11]MDH6414870.1 UDP-N-acetylmuramoyl-L-alanyl-D-glutamate--2,6-diaminopimela
MKLSEIFKDAPDIEVSGLYTDSRSVKENGMFFCLDGIMTNGHKFIKQAVKKGAKTIVHSEDIKTFLDDVVYIKVENVDTALNQVINKFYHYPSEELKVFGVTGTNGKSTVTNIIKDIYDHFAPCGYIGTISIEYKNVKMQPNLTTPDAIFLNRTLRDMVDDGVKAVALEVSSHGLEQHRVDAIDFDIAVFTNFTYDHLDFHGTIENYFHAKSKLFSNLKEDGISVLNVDDPKYTELADVCHGKVVTYGIHHECDYLAKNLHLSMKESSFTLVHKEKVYPVTTNLVAEYNIYNLLAAIAAIVESGIEIEEVLKYVGTIDQIEGRLEIIDEGQPFNVIVDFAHTPDGLEKIFQFATSITPEDSSIIAVFGSAGRRDVDKRKVFGEVASKFCDTIILTEDDPRDEDPREIANQIKSGIQGDARSIYIEDRYGAIRQAIEQANPNDTVLVLGKGDEVFMYREEGRSPWVGDHNAAREIIRRYYLGSSIS